MAKAARTKEELWAYLDDHIRYERTMLDFTFGKLSAANGLEWNAMFESFGVHARNLYDFFRHKGDITAGLYVNGRSKSPHIQTFDYNNLNETFFHLSFERLKNDKFNTDRAQELYDWVDREWQAWVAALPIDYQQALSGDPQLNLGSGPPQATNQFQSTNTSHSVTMQSPAVKGGGASTGNKSKQ